ncbi:hypothetical protein OQJ26_15040 [Legionella sp. PATHC038]|uniref:hypothetical protein n=1 Tax=Legionella sheltonii TaxID=2992041 RepID=UPI002243B590|nr:hypothetical protein [Legionella sp. PATHC038]MCW8400098.1 hypothetical protein [Legionella sp. PATHC038]
MEAKTEHPIVPTQNTLSVFEFKTKLTNTMKECAISKLTFEMQIDSSELKKNHGVLIELHEQMIARVKKQIVAYQGLSQDAEYYDEYNKEELQSRISKEIARQTSYQEKLQLKLPQINSLKFLFSLPPNELFQEAVKNKSSALLIIQTPELIAQIANYQLEHITHEDHEIVRSLASILATREYTSETANIFAALKQHVQAESDTQFIAAKENSATHNLLLKINNYLDKKIAQASKGNSNPWALGYFGSRHKVNSDGKKVPVPQGIYELKAQLIQLGTRPPTEILTKMQDILHTKNLEKKDESVLKQFIRLISYLFGYSQSRETADEYEYLEQVTTGKQSIP